MGRPLRLLGVGRLSRSIYRRLLEKETAQEVTLFGQRLQFEVGSYLEAARLFAPNPAEERFGERMLRAIRPNDVVYDMGANIGAIALPLAALKQAEGVTVHAFEPEPYSAKRLHASARLNSLDNVAVHEIALGAATGTASFFVDKVVGSGRHSLFEQHTGPAMQIEVEVLTAADFVRRSDSAPDVVKMDVEGAEMDVLRGMKPLLDHKRVRELFIEIHGPTLEKLGTSAEALRGWLRERGYRCIWSQQRGHECHEHWRPEGATEATGTRANA